MMNYFRQHIPRTVHYKYIRHLQCRMSYDETNYVVYILVVMTDDISAHERTTDGLKGKTADKIRLIEPEEVQHIQLRSSP